MALSSRYEEQELLCAIASGDERAFCDLYAHYFPVVFGFVLKYINVPALAEDIVQDVFVKIWEARNRLTGVRHFPAFLFSVARNHSLNVLQSVSRSQNAMATLSHHYQEQRQDDEVLNKDYSIFIEKVLRRVPPRSRDIFRKCREQGLSYEEVALEIGISRNAVKNHMVSTIRVLREAAYKELGISLGACVLLFAFPT
ncbi:RNA polymerase sigma factor [Dinghuibacter silviterrae]|uniref:RNA polymerase sigma factor n=1 Tax=Dinghuibacter silviterrae TaxID=1539049 RepID=A0A4R8DEP6_9BACT|nr:RNA polymerase sigma-70 factor [Dinghuibacter silviterrae]TDW95905.1 RNA polymerase sigma-70 factor (ECF subfamily) [Dinghuibacter silviterrae]